MTSSSIIIITMVSLSFEIEVYTLEAAQLLNFEDYLYADTPSDWWGVGRKREERQDDFMNSLWDSNHINGPASLLLHKIWSFGGLFCRCNFFTAFQTFLQL